MIGWMFGIGIWLLLVAAVRIFFKRRLAREREFFEEDAEYGYEENYEDYEEAGEYEAAGEYEETEGMEDVGPVEYYEDQWDENAWDNENYPADQNYQDQNYQEQNYQDQEIGEGSRVYHRGDERAAEQERKWAGPDVIYVGNGGSRARRIEDQRPEQRTRQRPEQRPRQRTEQRPRQGLEQRAGQRTGIFGKLALLFVLVGVVYLLLPYYCVRREMTIEAGEKCPGVESFLNWGGRQASFVSAINENTVLDRAGDYGVIIKVYGRKVAAVLHVESTVVPHIATKKVAILRGESVKAGDFVEEVEGITPVDIRFAREPDCMTGGINTVLLEIEDEGGRITTAEALLEVIEDTEPPVIHGVGELTMTAGGSISYKKGVTVTDNYDSNVKLDVDSSAVDIDKAGDYRVIYTAVDSAGNKTSVSAILHVQPMTVDTVTEEAINAEADKLLAEILTDSMSQYEQARAIYNWCHSKIAYSDGTPKTNWVQGAYRGLVDRKGDCYVYAATAKCLLTRAGITNMDIEKIPAKTMHYWNLIDIGEGWHHFDTCRRKDGSTFFYKTDAELMEYSNAHGKTHDYDRSLYPEIK